MSKTEYAYTVGEVGTAIKTYNYAYLNAWKDQLTSFDGTAITYDASGNPTSYLGKTLTWSRGRLLTNFVSGYTMISAQYDANGIRKNKARINTAPGVIGDIVATSYFYDNSGKLLKESTNGYTRYYFYNSDGIVGYEENGEKLLYRKNLFGDITAIYKGTTKVAEYTYDAWGNCTITHDVDGYSARNPFRYRGYYFDNDLNMYYLLTRYYDPKIGRFINADAIEYLKPENINGLNLYAYCNNNPVMHTDASGNAGAIIWLSLLLIAGGAVVGAIAGVLADHKFGSNIDNPQKVNPPDNLPIIIEDNIETDDESLNFGDRMLNMVKGGIIRGLDWIYEHYGYWRRNSFVWSGNRSRYPHTQWYCHIRTWLCRGNACNPTFVRFGHQS